jgi:hypothetical protein
MSCDFEPGEAGACAPARRGPPPHPQDLEYIVAMLEIAALSLSGGPGATFTADRLAEEVRALGGGDIARRDLDAVLASAGGMFRKRGRDLSLRT